MASVLNGRRTSDLEDHGNVVVFLIGMRVNRLWQFWRWIPVLAAMPRMILELAKDPCRGIMGRPRTFVSGRVVMVVQYWKSFEDLERYARDPQGQHLPAWRAFNRRVRDNGSVGIFHETYRVAAVDAETVYVNMPAFGLAGATAVIPVTSGRQTAAARLGVRPLDIAPVAAY
ncbi:MAG: DUF4188 domain-containing protein [Mycobacteriaceae bacterium]